MRYEFTLIATLTLFNVSILGYWASIWLKSLKKYRDTISLIVFLFILQNLLNELWVMTIGLFALFGANMQSITLYGNSLERIITLISLVVIYYLTYRMENDQTNS
jgi:hypothetical protein